MKVLPVVLSMVVASCIHLPDRATLRYSEENGPGAGNYSSRIEGGLEFPLTWKKDEPKRPSPVPVYVLPSSPLLGQPVEPLAEAVERAGDELRGVREALEPGDEQGGQPEQEEPEGQDDHADDDLDRDEDEVGGAADEGAESAEEALLTIVDALGLGGWGLLLVLHRGAILALVARLIPKRGS